MVKQKRKSHLVKKGEQPKLPRIIIKDLPLSYDYYRFSRIILDDNTIYSISWHEQLDFKRALSRLKRHYKFSNQNISDVTTQTKRHVSDSFTAKGFIP